MQSLDSRVMNQALSWIEEQPVWLCTVISTYGSSPRAPGSLLVANRKGAICGSLSGGCVEEDFLCRLRAGDYLQASQVIRYGDGGLAPDRPLPCGGSLEVLIEYLPPTAESLRYLQRQAAVIEGHGALVKQVTLPDACHSLLPCDWRSSTRAERKDNHLTLTVAAAPRLLIAGLSAVALYCSEFATALGFETLVCENRPEVLEDYAASLSDEIRLVRQFPAKYIEMTGCANNCAVVSLTHDPRVDDLTLMEAVETEAFYIGAIGSHRNSEKRRERLKAIAGLSEEALARIHAPVGLAIGSKTPAEIALAVMADVVRHKNLGQVAR